MRQTAGICGFVFLLFGFFLFFIAGKDIRHWIVLIHLIGGSVLVLFFFLSNMKNLTEMLGKRSTKYGTNVLLYSVIVLTIIALVNFVASRHPKRFDLTEMKQFTLAEQSLKVIRNLPREVKITGFFQGGESGGVEDLLKAYTYAGDRVSYEIVDADQRVDLREKYDITEYGTLLIQSGPQETRLTEPMEESITNAIIKVSRDISKKVCFLSGHGEHDLEDEEAKGYSYVKRGLENENYQVEKLELFTQKGVPDACAVLVVPGPKRPLVGQEEKSIAEYLEGGGKALFLLDPRDAPGFEKILEPWAIEVGNDILLDKQFSLFAMGLSIGTNPVAASYGVHEITEGFKERTVYTNARSVSLKADREEGLEAVELVKTSPDSWAETNIEGVFNREMPDNGPDDKDGPVSIAVALEAGPEKTGGEGEKTKLVVFGDSDFVDNRNYNQLFNADLFLNTIGWLAGEEELISIRPKMPRASRVALTTDQIETIFFVSVFFFPELLLICGIIIWRRRR